MTTLEEANVMDDLKVAKDLFSGAVGGIAQVLIGEYFHLLVYVFGRALRASSGPECTCHVRSHQVVRHLHITFTTHIYCRYAVIVAFRALDK